MMQRFLLAALASALCASTSTDAQTSSATPLPPPPENMAVDSEGRGSSLGYVVSLGYFSEAEMQDPEWEFARAKIANMWWCRSEARLRRRDIRWVPANDGSGKQCAMTIYTSECLEPRDVAENVDPGFSDRLEQDRHELMTQAVPGPTGAGCGEKDRALRYDPPSQ